MFEVAKDLQREGKIDSVLRLEHRGGKSAAVNLGLSAWTGDIVVISDVDTTFDRSAFAEMLGYFADPRVGAVSGSLGVRNASASLITRHQAIEYAIGIALGRIVQDVARNSFDRVGCFWCVPPCCTRTSRRTGRRSRRRRRSDDEVAACGLAYSLCPDAHALTDAPETVSALIAQRLRWDRGLITIWMRKYRSVFDPRQSTFRLIDVAALRRDCLSGSARARVSLLSLLALLLFRRACRNHPRGDAGWPRCPQLP